MAAYEATLKVYNQALVLQGTFTNVIAGSGKALLNRVGYGECTVKVQASTSAIVEGNIAVVYTADTVAAGDLAVAIFTIEEMHVKTMTDGMSEIRISGRDPLGELTGYLHFMDIGARYATDLYTKVTPTDPVIKVSGIGDVSSRITGEDADPGDDHVKVASGETSLFAVGDDLLIGKDGNGASHLTSVESKDAGLDYLYIVDDIPTGFKSSQGDYVFIPEAYLGDTIIIDLDAPDADHITRVESQPVPNTDDAAFVRLRENIPTGTEAAISSTVTFISSKIVTTDDIYWVMYPANADWTLTTTAAGTPAGGGDNGGTLIGTAHQIDGANIIQLLISCNELTSEWFRLERTSASTVERVLSWRASSDSSGITLTMPSTQVDTTADNADATKGLIHSMTAETRWNIATAIVPRGGSDKFDLSDKTVADSGNYTTFRTNAGKWAVRNDNGTLATDYNYARYITFDGIKEKSTNVAAIQEAANELYAQSQAYLAANGVEKNYKRIRTVLHANPLPGQSIVISYSETNWTESVTAYIVEISHSVGANGVRYTELLVSEDSPYNRNAAEVRLLRGSSVSGSVTSRAGDLTNVSYAPLNAEISGDFVNRQGIYSTLKIDPNAAIQQGEGEVGTDFSGIKISSVAGIGTIAAYDNDVKYASLDDDGFICYVPSDGVFYPQAAFTFNDADTNAEFSGLYSAHDSAVSYVMKLETLEVIDEHVGIEINADAATDKDAYIYLVTRADSGDVAAGTITITSVASTGITDINMGADYVGLTGGLSVGDVNGTPDAGQLILDQGTTDGIIMKMSEDGITHGMTAIVENGVYGFMQKNSAANGALNIVGLGMSEVGTKITGYSTTAVTKVGGVFSTSSNGPVVTNAALKSGTGITTLGTDDVIFAVQNNGATEFLVAGDGQYYADGSFTQYDDYDDVHLVRAASLLSPEAIRTTFDDFVQYNRDDLEAAGLISGTMVNQSGFIRLHSGAIWQLHKRIAQLEAQLGN